MKEDKFCLNKSVAFIAVVILFIIGVVLVSTQVTKQNLTSNSKAEGSCTKGLVKWDNGCVIENGKVFPNSDLCEREGHPAGMLGCCNTTGIPSFVKDACDKTKRDEAANAALTSSNLSGDVWEGGRCLTYSKDSTGATQRVFNNANDACCNAVTAPSSHRDSAKCVAYNKAYFNKHALGAVWENDACLIYEKNQDGNVERKEGGSACCSFANAPKWYKDNDICGLTGQQKEDLVNNHAVGFFWEGGCVKYSGAPGYVSKAYAPRSGRDCCCGQDGKTPGLVSGTPASMCDGLNLANWCAQ